MASPASIKVTTQDTDYDCGIACLSMVLDEPYVEVHAAAAKALKKWPDKGGLTTRQMQTIAKKLGHTLNSFDPKKGFTSPTGILLVGGNKHYHFVVLFEGVVVEPTYGKIWNLDAYLKFYKLRPVRYLQS